jgi:hypothetical protein
MIHPVGLISLNLKVVFHVFLLWWLPYHAGPSAVKNFFVQSTAVKNISTPVLGLTTIMMAMGRSVSATMITAQTARPAILVFLFIGRTVPQPPGVCQAKS